MFLKFISFALQVFLYLVVFLLIPKAVLSSNHICAIPTFPVCMLVSVDSTAFIQELKIFFFLQPAQFH